MAVLYIVIFQHLRSTCSCSALIRRPSLVKSPTAIAQHPTSSVRVANPALYEADADLTPDGVIRRRAGLMLLLIQAKSAYLTRRYHTRSPHCREAIAREVTRRRSTKSSSTATDKARLSQTHVSDTPCATRSPVSGGSECQEHLRI